MKRLAYFRYLMKLGGEELRDRVKKGGIIPKSALVGSSAKSLLLELDVP